jgi:hypothetical protein
MHAFDTVLFPIFSRQLEAKHHGPQRPSVPTTRRSRRLRRGKRDDGHVIAFPAVAAAPSREYSDLPRAS